MMPSTKGSQSIVVDRIRIGPGSIGLGLAGSFFHVGKNAVDFDGPGADQGLVKQVLSISIRANSRGDSRR